MGRAAYHFSTYDANSENGDVSSDVAFGDVEGTWSHVYFSYSLDAGKAFGYLRIGDHEVVEVNIQAVHTESENLRLIVGGRDFETPSFNGQIASVIFSTRAEAFVASV